MFFEVGKHQLNGLPAPSVERCGCLRLHPSLMCEDEGFVCTPPQAAAHFGAGGALPTERTRWARLPLHPVAPDALLTPAAPRIRLAPYPLQHMASRTPIGRKRGEPLAVRFVKERTGGGCVEIMGFPGTIQGHMRGGTRRAVHPCHIATVDQHVLQA